MLPCMCFVHLVLLDHSMPDYTRHDQSVAWYKRVTYQVAMPSSCKNHAPHLISTAETHSHLNTVAAAYNLSVHKLQRIMLNRKYMGYFCQAITLLFKGLLKRFLF